MAKEVCVPAIKLTKERLLEERAIIDEKIKALDIVLGMFDKDPAEDVPGKKIKTREVLSEEEKKAKKKKYMQDYFANKKKKDDSITVEKGEDSPVKNKKSINYDDMG